MIFATAAIDPSPLNTLGVPGLIFIIVVQAGVIVYQNRENKRINDLLLTTTREVLTAINNFVEVQRSKLRG